MIPIATGQPGTMTRRTLDEHVDALAAQVATYRHGKVPADLRRAHIVAIAFSLFADHAFADVSMDEIARRAGVSKPVVYALAGDKERIFRACVELATFALGERVRTAMRSEHEPEPCLRAGARAFFEFVAESGPGWDRLVATQGGPVSAELEAARRHQADLVAELLTELFARQRAERGLALSAADRLQIEAIAHSMNGACERLAAWWRRHPGLSLDELVELSTRVVAAGVIGIIDEPLDGWGAEGGTP